MPLDPALQVLLNRMRAAGAPPMHTLSPEQARRMFALAWSHQNNEPVGSVENRTFEGPNGEIPVRIYKPEQASSPLPVLVFYHGGGWVIGDLDTHDNICRWLTNRAACAVISVDYRLAPEHKFPAAVDDAFAALQWVAREGADLGLDPNRIAVGGDSAGGNLSAVVSLLAKEQGGPHLVLQLLIYPATDNFNIPPSKLENSRAAILDEAMMRYFIEHYLNHPDETQNPLCSPMLAEDHRELPPALIITAEMDPLRDEGMAYAEKLRQAGVEVEATCYKGMVHGFVSMAANLEAGKQAVQQAADALKRAFGTAK